jgi:hypothetical protein
MNYELIQTYVSIILFTRLKNRSSFALLIVDTNFFRSFRVFKTQIQ